MIFDAVIRAPLLGSMLMCLSAAIVGVFIFFERRSLVGETLSHAAYPGVVLSALLPIHPLIAAFFSALTGLGLIHFLEKKAKVKSDVALCFTLSSLFGIGVLLASRVQFINPLSYRAVQIFLFGQAATLRDSHLILYGALSILTMGTIAIFLRPLALFHFDKDFARAQALPIKLLQVALAFLLALSLVIGMRSVGIVLLSAMLIAPPVAARAFTKRLKPMLFLSAFFGLLSGFLGTALPVLIPGWAILPTGPTIVVIATCLALIGLLFSPEKGLIFRAFSRYRFRLKCQRENVLKALPCQKNRIKQSHLVTSLKKRGWCYQQGKELLLTPSGEKEKKRLIRLHRLWEVYLVHMGQDATRVHASAEEMEHLLTKDLERELSTLLNEPTHDPHQKPIPERGV